MASLIDISQTLTTASAVMSLGKLVVPVVVNLPGSWNGAIYCDFSWDGGTTWITQFTWNTPTDQTFIKIETGDILARLRTSAGFSGTCNAHVGQV